MISPEADREFNSELTHQEVSWGIVTGVANHEAKLALSALIAAQPDKWFSQAELWHLIKDAQGDIPAWTPDRQGPIKYCINSLAPIGLVAKGTVASSKGEVTAFKANYEQPEAVYLGRAVAGALMSWSVEYPDLSVQKVLGVTAKKGQYRTPELRLKMLKVIDESDQDQLSYIDIASKVEDERIDRYAVYSNIRALADAEILDTHVIDAGLDIKLKIVDPEFHHRNMHIEDLKHESRVVYGALQMLWEEGKREISFQEVVDKACAIDPSINPYLLRSYWNQGSSSKSLNMPGLAMTVRSIDDQSRLTTVKIRPEHIDAIHSLINHMDKIMEGKLEDLAEYVSLGHKMLTNPSVMFKIFKKAHKFSSNVAGQEAGGEVAQQQILKIIKSTGSLSVKQVFEACEAEGFAFTKQTVDNHLRGMTKAGVLKSTVERPDPNKKRQLRFFSLSIDNT